MRHKLLVAFMLLAGSAAQAAPLEPASAITAAIASQLDGAEGKVMSNGGAMMPACQAQLSVSWLPSEDDTFRTASVTCPSPSWTIYAGVRIVKRHVALVASRAIAVGEVIDSSDTASREVVLSDVHGALLSPQVLTEGVKATRAIPEGEPVTRSMTDLTRSVHSGQQVVLRVNQGGLVVSAPGQALQDGAIGDSVAVENAESHRRLSAIIVRSAPQRSGVYLIAPAE